MSKDENGLNNNSNGTFNSSGSAIRFRLPFLGVEVNATGTLVIIIIMLLGFGALTYYEHLERAREHDTMLSAIRSNSILLCAHLNEMNEPIYGLCRSIILSDISQTK